MSLQIWLPLNGNTNNQGLLGDAKITGNAGFVSTGKIGAKSMNSGTLILSAKDANKILNNDAFSYCCWIYVNADASTTAGCNAFFGREGMNGGGNRQFSMFQYSNVNSLHWSWQNDTVTDNSVIAVGMLNNIFPSKTWTHFAMAYKKGEYKFYTNGKCIYTDKVTCNSLTYYYSLPIVVCSNARYLNDVRLYNHCLSPKEVNEIARGLVGHYKLDNSGGINPNLIKGNFSCTSTKTEYKQTGNVTTTVLSTDILNNKGKTLVLSYDVHSTGTYTANTAGNWQATRFGIHGSVKYTKKGATSATQNYPLAGLLERGKDGHVETTWTIPSDIESVQSNLDFSIQTNGRSGYAYPASDNDETWYIKNVKLEWANTSTPWCPNIADADWGINNAEDSSGFANNGSFVNGILSADITSPRYESGYNFTNPKHIKITQPLVNPNELTVSFWVKPQSGCGSYSTISSNYSNPSSGFWIGINTESSPVWFYSNGYCKANGTLLTMNTWYHLVLTSKDGKFTWYKNGEKYCEADLSNKSKTVAITNAISIGNSYTGSSWNTAFNGSISDFRIYCTALSADDVKDLYTTSASIGSDGKSYMYEYKEV